MSNYGRIQPFSICNLREFLRFSQLGYISEEVNGDGLVGLSDMPMIEANSDNFVSSVLP